MVMYQFQNVSVVLTLSLVTVFATMITIIMLRVISVMILMSIKK